MKTNERRNAELAKQLATAIRGAGFECDDPHGWSDSLYAEISGYDWSGEFRISDHQQVAGGGFSENTGERHGESDIYVVIDSGPDAGLAWGDGDTIVHVAHARVTFVDDVPDQLISAIEPVVAEFANRCAARTASAKRGAQKRRENAWVKAAADLVDYHLIIQSRMTGLADVEFVREPDAAPGDPGSPRPFVPAGTPFRSARMKVAAGAITAVYQATFAERRAAQKA